MKQRITAIAAKVRRYQGRVDTYMQNRLFENNQRQFYWELDQEGEKCDDDTKQEKVDITTGSLKKILGRMPN